MLSSYVLLMISCGPAILPGLKLLLQVMFFLQLQPHGDTSSWIRLGIPPPWRVRILHILSNCHHPSTPVISHLVTDLDDHVNIPLLHFHSLTFLLSLHQLFHNTTAFFDPNNLAAQQFFWGT